MSHKTVWITGASSGIGREFACRYAKLGFRLILTARRRERLDQLAAELLAKYNTFCRVLPADLARESECTRLCEELAEERIDIFINNAGFGVCGSFLETSTEAELSMAKVNVLAMHQLCKFAVQKMQAQGFGTVLRSEMFRHINTLSHGEIDQIGTPSLITRITNDVNQLQLAVAMLIRLVVRAPFLVIGATVMALLLDWKLACIFFVAAPLMALVLYLVMSRSIPFYRIIQKKLDRISLITRENLSGVRVIRAFPDRRRRRNALHRPVRTRCLLPSRWAASRRS